MDSPLASPTKARQAAIQAKDWAFVNSWLNRHYAPNPIPKFERNEDTLRTLLALAAANEAADEEAAMLNHAREQAIEGFKAREKSEELQKVEILDEVEHCLDDTGAGNLEDLAETVAVLGTLGTKTNGYLERELITLGEQLDKLKSDPAFETPANLPALTSEWTRSTKLLNSKVNEYQDRTTALERNSNKGATLEKVMLEEDEVGRMIESIKSLETKIKMFHDLPKDIASARAKYQDLETELNQLTQERDSMFENLVDR